MSQIWNDKGKVVPVTMIAAGPCYVSQIKTAEKDGYDAIQLGLGNYKKLTKPMQGHLKDLPNLRHIREFMLHAPCSMLHDSKVKRGDVIDVGVFAPGDIVKVTGISKGKGFQGVVKRHHFHGHPSTHGHKDQERMPGAIGAGGVQHVLKGQRMAGRMGTDRVTVRNLEIVAVDKEHNLLTIKGAVPGARGGLLVISGLE